MSLGLNNRDVKRTWSEMYRGEMSCNPIDVLQLGKQNLQLVSVMYDFDFKYHSPACVFFRTSD